MKRHVHLLATTAILSSVAMPALALTPQEVWDNWTTAAATVPGLTMTHAEPVLVDGGIAVRDFSVTLEKNGETLSLAAPDLQILAEDGDTVVLTAPEDLTAKLVSGGDLIVLGVSGEGLGLRTTGAGGMQRNEVSAEQLEVTLVEAAFGGKPAEGEGQVTFADFGAVAGIMAGDVIDLGFSWSLMSSDANIALPDMPGNAVFAMEMGAVDFDGRLNGLKSLVTGDFPAALRAGAAIVVASTAGNGSYSLDFPAPGGDMVTAKASWGESSSDLVLNADGFSIASRGVEIVSGSTAQGTSAEFVIPELAYELSLPLLASPDVQAAHLGIEMRNMSMMFEGGMVPAEMLELLSEPVSLVADIDLRGIIGEDLLTDKLVVAPGAVPPGELKGVDVNELFVEGAGASLLARGTAELVAGFVALPEGKFHVELDKVVELHEKLTALGLATPDMGMMLAMVQGLAEKGENGELILEIESGKDGLKVNGTPM